MLVITSIVSVVPIATPRTVRLMLDTIGIPASLIPVNDAARHPKSDPNKNGSGAFKESRSRPNARQIRMVLACTMRLELTI